MSLLLAVFSVIYLGITAIMQYAHTKFAENSLDEAFDTMSVTKEPAADKIVIINDNIMSGLATIDENNIQILYNAAKRYGGNGKFGQYKYFYYKFYVTPNNSYNIFIAIDMKENLVSLRIDFVTTFVFLLTIYIMIFLLVWKLSYKVFQPIKETFDKQKRFISDAAHELKTPLTIISASADVLKQSGEDNQFVENIKHQTARLDGLVADMLSLAKIDEGRIQIENEVFNVSETVTECVLPFDAVAFEKNKTLETYISPDIVYCGDRNSVKKITNILVDNAIKYSDGNVKVKLKREGGKNICLTVFNTGSNIPDQDANKIFERFYRGENSRSRESGGSGLGLSIAKSIADANKWKIHAESVFGKSMTISVVMKI